MTGNRTVPVPRGRPFMAALIVACALMAGPPAFAQGTPPGFDSIPRPPGSIGPSQNLMPPGSSSGVLAPQAPASPLQLSPQPAQPVALPPAAPPAPPSTATVTPSVPMVPAGQVALMVNAR